MNKKDNLIQRMNTCFVYIIAFFLFFSCNKKQKDHSIDKFSYSKYHIKNQPKYSVNNFLETEQDNIIHKIYGWSKFHKEKRLSYNSISFFEMILRSLKGDIKTISITEKQLKENHTNTFSIDFNINGKIITKKSIEKNSKATENFTFNNGKLYIGRDDYNYPIKYQYHANGNKYKAINKAFKTTYHYNSNGILDSIIEDSRKKTDYTKTTEKYSYTNNLITSYKYEKSDVFKNKKRVLRNRTVLVSYIENTDLPYSITKLFYEKSAISSKETRLYYYNKNNELTSENFTRTEFKNPKLIYKSKYNYTYEYDKKGNWIKIICSNKNKVNTVYSISYEYYK